MPNATSPHTSPADSRQNARETARQHYLERIDAHQSTCSAPDWLQQLRHTARARFAELGFPTTRDEEWKYTDIAPMANLPIVAPHLNGVSHQPPTLDSLKEFLFSDLRLVFLDGRFAPQLSATKNLPDGVVIADLCDSLQHPAVQQHLAQYATKTESDAFTALNTALLDGGAFVYLPANVVLETPLQLLWLHSQEVISHPRALLVAERGAQCTVIETYADSAGNSESVYFQNDVTEVVVGENAGIDHYRVQLESESALHVGTLQVDAARDANFRSHSLQLGGRLVRHNAYAVMNGENIECTLNGLVLTHSAQHIDNHTVMDHAQPHCLSHEHYVHILDGESTAVFNGKIFVRQDAQKTDAVQSNRTLLLSDKATINTKPQLEIFADDVKCTHGATIGQLEEGALFYLRARGIPENAARDLLIYAFAEEVLEGVRVKTLREQIESELSERLAQARQAKVTA